jgi:hypothetical protein
VIGFQSEVTLVPLSKAEIARRGLPRRWHGQFTTDLVVESEFCGTFTIPAGFITDGGTIPRLAWNLIDPSDPNILYPAFAHDWPYSTHGHLLEGRVVTKDQTDQMIRELMKSIGDTRLQYDAVYRAVHWFGHFDATAKLVGMRRSWNSVTPAAKLAKTPFAFKSNVRFP